MANPNRQGRYPGHGQTVPRSRFAIPIRGFVRGVPVRSNTAPWFLKPWGSRPASKTKRRALAAVA